MNHTQTYATIKQLKKNADQPALIKLRDKMLDEVPELTGFTQTSAKKHKKSLNIPGRDKTQNAINNPDQYTDKDIWICLLASCYDAICDVSKVLKRKAREAEQLSSGMTNADYLKQLKLFGSKPALTNTSINSSVILNKINDLTSLLEWEKLQEELNPLSKLGRKTVIIDQYRLIKAQDNFTYDGQVYSKDNKSLFTEAIVYKIPNALISSVIVYAKFYEKYNSLKRDRSKDKAYQKAYDARPERKQKKKENRDEFKDRHNSNLQEWRDNMPDDKKEEYRNKAMLRAREFRKSEWYQDVYLNLRKLKPNRRYSYLKRICEKNNVELGMDMKTFGTLMERPCKFCGQEPNYHEFKMNWVIRKDTNKGFVRGNVITACDICSKMKCSDDPRTFVEKVLYIAHYKRWIDYPKYYNTRVREYFEHLYGYGSVTYSKYCEGAKNRKINMELSKDEFKKLTTNQKCFYSGIKSDIIGIDRINSVDPDTGSKLPYSIENCVPCLPACNYLKCDLDLDSFKLQCIKIFDHVVKK